MVKAEHLAKGDNPRYVVTSLTREEADARTLYEDLYCARGDMEIWIVAEHSGMAMPHENDPVLH